MAALFLCLGQVLGRGELDGERCDETPKRHGVLRCAQLWYGQDAFDLIRKRRAATLSTTLSRDSIALGQAGRRPGLPEAAAPISVCVPMQNVLIAAMLVTVSAGKDKALHLYELQPDSEKLVQHAKYDLPGSPGSQFVSPDGQRL